MGQVGGVVAEGGRLCCSEGMPDGPVLRGVRDNGACSAEHHCPGLRLWLEPERRNTQDNTGMPPLEIGLITGGMFILLEGVIIANMNQIQFTPRQARCMGWRPSLLLFVLIDKAQ
ncbi:uncharacterized protein WM294_008918 [Sarcoramphus papa]